MERRIEENSNNPFRYNLFGTVNKYGQMRIIKCEQRKPYHVWSPNQEVTQLNRV